ncbi:unnamed protein product [Anisakis simplex]|uniref:Transmembrane protein n=1 Tax=Anisakis simplex TaxID=6269 RepID=A0A0M3KIS9_ANISI|nr:unnamed protein product [Anisakis simplex]
MKYCCEVFGIDSDSVTPMLFYVYAHFAMAGFGVFALFLCVWRLYDSWLYGLLVFAWMCTNLEDSTRVFFSVNLRENFSLPLFWLQNLFIINILDDFGNNNDDNNNDNINNNGSNNNVKLLSPRRSTYRYMIVAFVIATFLFALFWQFNQSSSLFVTAVLKWKSSNRAISQILIAQSFALFCVAIAQFAQPMALFSVSTQFNAAVLITFALSRFFHQFKSAIGMVFVKTLVAFLFCVLINFCVNNGLNTSNSDRHIWTFVKAKLGMHDK